MEKQINCNIITKCFPPTGSAGWIENLPLEFDQIQEMKPTLKYKDTLMWLEISMVEN